VTGHAGAIRRVSIGFLLSMLALASCAKDDGNVGAGPTGSPTVSPSSTESPAATCDEPSQTKIALVASSTRFNVNCLVVPAGEPLTVTLENKDSYNHNFSIYTLDFQSEFTGDISYGGEMFHYKVPELEPGQYLFQCDIHPKDMSGPLIVQ
jgi:plastocyanin